jgi:hypothetical protein
MKASAFYVSLNVNLITKAWIIGTEDILDLYPPHTGIYTIEVDDEINNFHVFENLVYLRDGNLNWRNARA